MQSILPIEKGGRWDEVRQRGESQPHHPLKGAGIGVAVQLQPPKLFVIQSCALVIHQSELFIDWSLVTQIFVFGGSYPWGTKTGSRITDGST